MCVEKSITREIVRHKQGSSFLHKASAVAVVLIEVGVVAAGHDALHAASAGRCKEARTLGKALCGIACTA
jgi:hypothetical protein